ncbi:LacI family xylobiose transport system transcriptional regulator [Streptomyces sp. SAI-041]|nr:LacI family xylobiose transport system transcriptional regulator [Streptomyces sp. SAI-041]
MTPPEPAETRTTSPTAGRSPQTATLAEIAREAGVSAPTVSKVLNGRADVAPATRARVEDLLRAHGYRRRRAEASRSPLIDLVFHELESAWAMEVIRGVENVARDAGLSVVLSESAGRLTPGRTWADQVAARRPHGVVLVLSGLDDSQRALLASRSIPFVVMDPAGDPGADVPSIGATNWQGGLAATRHLVELGHRRIGAISGPSRMMCSRARVDGYRAALETAGLPVDPELIVAGDFHHETGYRQGLELLRRPDRPTAVFAGQRPPGARRLRGRPRAGAAHPGGPQRGRLRRPSGGALGGAAADDRTTAPDGDGRGRRQAGARPGPGGREPGGDPGGAGDEPGGAQQHGALR